MKTEKEPLSRGYFATVLALMGALPVASIALERAVASAPRDLPSAIGAWFIFWGIGVRLATAGLRQIVQPSFTAREIFHHQGAESETIVRELGFANVCLGLTAILSLFAPGWRMAAAFGGGLYFGIAGLMHAIKRPATPNEWVALISDLFIFAIAAGWLALQIAR